MSLNFLNSISSILRFLRISIYWKRRSETYTYEHITRLILEEFPDCQNRQFRYGQRMWNPWGKAGFAHHGPNGWDFGLPDEKP